MRSNFDKQYGFSGRRYDAFFWRNGWRYQQIGIHVHLGPVNFELHVPFGFFRVGHTTNPLRGRWRHFSWGRHRWDIDPPPVVNPDEEKIVTTAGELHEQCQAWFELGYERGRDAAAPGWGSGGESGT